MKVLLINGSPHKEGCTYTALQEVAKGLEQNGVETQVFQLGKGAVHGCTACGFCDKEDSCVFENDPANECLRLMRQVDGVVVGSPVYYAGPNGALCALLDRVFYVGGGEFAGMPAAAVVSCRRAGSTASLDRLHKYFTISNMPLVSSQYWPMVHGSSPADVRQDEEGLQIMRRLGHNMAHMLHTKQPIPAFDEPRARTNFIR